MPFNVDLARQQFPSLSLKDNGTDRIYFDNPGGTQVPLPVLDNIRNYLIQCNANHGGYFKTSQESDRILHQAHQAMADFINAPSENEIIFGPNMTTLTFAISRSLAHWFKDGDEIILTRMDHDGNVAPWFHIAQDQGLKIKWLDFNLETYRYDLNQLETLITDRVKLIAINFASNAIGTINDISAISQLAHHSDIMVFLDAVQYVPHGPTDVQELDCDFLVCSAYKFFGPHQGILWAKSHLLDELMAYKVRPADDFPPGKFETGTQSHEGQAGTLGALEYLSWLGENLASEYHHLYSHFTGRRKFLHAAMYAIKEYEKILSAQLINGLNEIPYLKIHGITDLKKIDERVPTISFTHKNIAPAEISRQLAAENIYVWDGHYYALEVVKHLGLDKSGGMVRVGAVHYNTVEEINRLLTVLQDLSVQSK
jgi:cysteine desulfurase family protein (TIGR01976 family)